MSSLVTLLIFNVIIVYFPPVRMVLTVGFSYITFIMFSIYPLVLNSLRFLSLKYVEFCQSLLLHLLKWSFDFPFSIHLFLHLWDKAHLIMMDNIFAVCRICFMCIKEFSPSLFVLLDQNIALTSCSSFMMRACSYHMPTMMIMNLSSETGSYPPTKCFFLKRCFAYSLFSQQ